MKRILIFAMSALVAAGSARAAVRDGNATSRQKSSTTTTNTQRATTTEKAATARTATLAPRTTSTSRSAVSQKNAATTRGTTNTPVVSRAATSSGNASQRVSARTASTPVTSRAASTATAMSETRTGAEYEQCKNAFFTCMDQFCTLKNDDYRRCSCSNRVYDLADRRQVLQDAGERLTVFTENLNVVGMTAAQAAAMKTASEGENALTSDTSASKALLQAIMNSIRGTDSNVGGKYSDLNSINISFDTSNAFGMTDTGAAIAAYNGQNLYSAVYPQCRSAVKADCNDASLQRAITAYLMAIEQDCNTLDTAIAEKQKQMKSAIREGSAMLDLARVENRQNHNSSDIATCVANVETAILSEEVCGAGYHRCLDNGEFIDISTGAPIAGVTNFYELEKLLTFPAGVDAADQKLTKVFSNRLFVQNFENRVKKFAQPALDKCTEQADTVWSEYLDKAMLDIYYAQKAKVDQIRQGCFDFVSACYMNGDTSITDAMKELTGDAGLVVQPLRVVLNDKLCTDYVNSCNNMFDENIIQAYIQKRTDTDTLTACRAVVKQCFDKYGGSGYENFYYPYSGLFAADSRTAPNWFTLYEVKPGGSLTIDYGDGIKVQGEYLSECAKQLTSIEACNDQSIIETAFGGLDKIKATQDDTTYSEGRVLLYDGLATEKKPFYGLLIQQELNNKNKKTKDPQTTVSHRSLRPTGVATEIYNQIIDTLTTQCTNLSGRFVEYQFIRPGVYNENNFCKSNFTEGSIYEAAADALFVTTGENMCPREYGLNVATQSWGACLCWENGGRRSQWGQSAKCVAELPIKNAVNNGQLCKYNTGAKEAKITEELTESGTNVSWCTIPNSFINSANNNIQLATDQPIKDLPEGIK